MKNKNFKIGLILCALIPAFAAQAQESTPNPFKVDELQITTDNFVSKLRIQRAEREVGFPDYEFAYAQFLNESQTASEAFKIALNQMKKEAEQVLGKNLSDLNTLETIAKQQPNAVNLSLLKIQKSRFQTVSKVLTEKLNQEYHEALVSMFSLHGKLVFPVRHGLSRSTLYTMIGAVVLAPAGIMLAGFGGAPIVASAPFIEGALLTENTIFNESDPYFGKNLSRSETNTGVRSIVEVRSYQKHFREAADQVFNECSTGGCALKMSQVYRSWFSNTRKLDQEIDLGYDVVLHPMPLPNEQHIEKEMKKLGEVAARSKQELSVLEDASLK